MQIDKKDLPTLHKQVLVRTSESCGNCFEYTSEIDAFKQEPTHRIIVYSDPLLRATKSGKLAFEQLKSFERLSIVRNLIR
jgi:hypothetical protein